MMPLDDEAFDKAVDAALGDQLRADKAVCRKLWATLAESPFWRHVGSDKVAARSWRTAGDTIASIVGGSYLDWYDCAMPENHADILTVLHAFNWEPCDGESEAFNETSEWLRSVRGAGTS